MNVGSLFLLALVHQVRAGISGWTEQTSPTTAQLRSLAFVNFTHGYTGSGTILSTKNSGESWQQQTDGTNSNLNAVFFPKSTDTWGVADSGWAVAAMEARSWPPQTVALPGLRGTPESLNLCAQSPSLAPFSVGLSHLAARSWPPQTVALPGLRGTPEPTRIYTQSPL
jgi:photosystem II stability/assembly factor-like uncharacterized protein